MRAGDTRFSSGIVAEIRDGGLHFSWKNMHCYGIVCYSSYARGARVRLACASIARGGGASRSCCLLSSSTSFWPRAIEYCHFQSSKRL